MKLSEIKCHLCSKAFQRPTKEVTRSIKLERLQFCSLIHKAEYFASLRPMSTRSTKRNQRARRLWIKRHNGNLPYCWCGDIADIHHDDGDNTNNDPSNLIPLCRSHHTSLENSRFPKRGRTHVEGCLLLSADAGAEPATSTIN